LQFFIHQLLAGKKHCSLLIALLLLTATWIPAGSAQEVPIPTVEDAAARISYPEFRDDALYTIIAVARFLRQARNSETEIQAGQLQENLDWLNHLRSRYGEMANRSPVLDPAAWLIHLELVQRTLGFNDLVSPKGPGSDVFLDQVFDRSNERLAAVLLPELLWQAESIGTRVWSDLVEQMRSDETVKTAMAEAHSHWLSSWAGGAANMQRPGSADLFVSVAESLKVLVQDAISAGPPDRQRLSRVRYLLLSAIPGLDQAARQEAFTFLHLASLTDGLHERRYFSFAEGLLALATGLLDLAESDPPGESVAAHWLVDNLPLISNRFARDFAVVDPRLNSALAAAFDVVKDIASQGGTAQDPVKLRSELANSVAQLTLLIPDLDYYFDLPVRDSIAGGMDACIGIVARHEEDGTLAMTRDLYDDCQQSIVDLADREARAAALSGDADGPFGDDELERELTVTSGQRINYGIGFLHDR
jgi:hypothetical protein